MVGHVCWIPKGKVTAVSNSDPLNGSPTELRPDPDRFVNPYSFANLHGHVQREVPRLIGAPTEPDGTPTLSGTISVTWRLLAPLLVPMSADEDGWFQGDTLRIPGSAVKGVVRSTHEALFNGCLRVLDASFRPAHRTPPNRGNEADSRGQGLTLAVVTSTVDGAPTRVVLCEDEVWVEAVSLRHRLGRCPRSGDYLDIANLRDREVGAVGRSELAMVGAVTSGDRPNPLVNGLASTIPVPVGKRVILITDTAARPTYHKDAQGRRTDDITRCFWATGRVTDEVVGVSHAAIDDYRLAAFGARDLVEDRRPGETTGKYIQVKWWDKSSGTIPPSEKRGHWRPLAERRRVSLHLEPGDVVWVRRDSEEGVVSEISLSAVWRTLGLASVAQRLPMSPPERYPLALACRHPFSATTGEHEDGFPVGLCPTCRLFGSADTVGAGRGKGDNDGFAARVRFSSAVGTGFDRSGAFPLAPRGAPHPGAGGFYLSPRNADYDRPVGDVAAHWGSALDAAPEADGSGARAVRGRKFYWHSDPFDQQHHWSTLTGRQVRPRFRAGAHHGAGVRQEGATTIGPGIDLTARVAVDSISVMEAKQLLAALDPGRVLRLVDQRSDPRTYGVHLGGGKAFGLGTVVPIQVTVDLTTTASRYAATPTSDGGRSGPRWSGEDLQLAALDLRQLQLANSLGRLGQLARLLDVRGLEGWAAHVAYPPGSSWCSYDDPAERGGQTGAKAFDNSYAFFGRNGGRQDSLTDAQGRRKRTSRQPFATLPVVPMDTTAPFNPTLEVSPKA